MYPIFYYVFWYKLDEFKCPYIYKQKEFDSFESAFCSIDDWENDIFEICRELYLDVTCLKTVARNALTRSLFTSYLEYVLR